MGPFSYGPAVVIMAALIAAGLFLNTTLLSAQTPEPSAGDEVIEAPAGGSPPGPVREQEVSPEASIILGEAPPSSPGESGSSIGAILRMVVVLALAALAIYGMVFFIKRMSRPRQARDPHLKVLASVPLGPGAFAAVVSVGPKAWLVGGGDGGVSLIAEIDETEALESMLLDDARKNAETGAGRFPDFRSLLNHLGGRENKQENFHAESLRKQRERLKGL